MIDIEKLYDETQGGALLFQAYFPDFDPGKKVNLVKVRDDDDTPSASIFCKDGKWLIKDHGGTDNKAHNMVDFVKIQEHVEFKEAVEIIAAKCGILSDGGKPKPKAAPVFSKVPPTDRLRVIRRPSGVFTKKELLVLGGSDKDGNPCITQEICEQFNLIPLDGYIIADKQGKGFSWKLEATDDYPIMMYDYGDWGKLYQPFGDNRFMYVGEKPEGYLFGCKLFMKAWEDAVVNKKFPHAVKESGKKKKKKDNSDDMDEEEKDERWEALTICSGPSDALNVYRAGHVVCWPNSESEPLSAFTIRTLMKLTRNLYVLYDADATGLRNAYKLALSNLEIQVITLPDDLGTFSTGKRDKDGNLKYCKDIKDFCMYYKKGKIDPYYEFKHRLVKLAKPLKFWTEEEDDNGNKKVQLSNAHLYRFLSACGFHRMKANVGKTMDNEKDDDWRFVFEKEKVIEVIPESSIVARVRDFLVRFIMENTEYYSVLLENTIYRSKQINIEQLKNLDVINPNFDAYTADSEYYFFQNSRVAKVTKDKIEIINPEDCPYHVLKHKVIRHNIDLLPDLFTVSYSEAYTQLTDQLERTSPDTPEFDSIKNEIVKLTTENKKYGLAVGTDLDFVRYLYNTGNKYWREEKEAARQGASLSDEERNAIDKNFINKITTIGYMLCKYKSRGLPKAVYCMETSVLEEDEGSHQGGTGKSLFMSCFNMMRKSEFLNGQAMKDNKWDFVYQRITFDTDIVSIDDINSSIDMNRFLPDITGDLQVNPKNKSDFVIPYDRSPKFCFTSNHAIKRFDKSLRRRIQFVSFSDYYHSADPESGIEENSPRSEFGRDLIRDYDQKDMNKFYNLMLQSVKAFMQYGLVEPDMPDIELRQKRASIGLVFIDWADQYFSGIFNNDIDRNEAFLKLNDYCRDLHIKNAVTKNTFTKKVKQWCEIRGFVYNPEWWMATLSDADQKRKLKRKQDDVTKEMKEYFYIENKEDGRPSGYTDNCPF